MIRYIYMVWSEFFFGPDPPWWCLMWLGNSELLGPPFPPDSTVLAATNHAVDPAMTARMELPTSRLCWKRGWWVALAVSYDILSGAYSRFHGYDSGCGIFAYLHGVCIYIYICVCVMYIGLYLYISYIYTVYIYIYITICCLILLTTSEDKPLCGRNHCCPALEDSLNIQERHLQQVATLILKGNLGLVQ